MVMVGCNLCAQNINNFECQRLLQESEVKKLILCTCPARRRGGRSALPALRLSRSHDVAPQNRSRDDSRIATRAV